MRTTVWGGVDDGLIGEWVDLMGEWIGVYMSFGMDGVGVGVVVCKYRWKRSGEGAIGLMSERRLEVIVAGARKGRCAAAQQPVSFFRGYDRFLSSSWVRRSRHVVSKPKEAYLQMRLHKTFFSSTV